MTSQRRDDDTRAKDTREASVSRAQTDQEEEEHQKVDCYANWHQIKADLIDIKEGFKKEKENNEEIPEHDDALI